MINNYPLKNLFKQFQSIIVIDTETSGLDFEKNRVIELAALKLKVEDNEIVVKNEISSCNYYSNRYNSMLRRITGILRVARNNAETPTTIIHVDWIVKEFVTDKFAVSLKNQENNNG